MKYEILEHPAELRIKVYGKTLEELFSNAALAMSEILKGDSNYANEHSNDANRELIKIESVDINSLLVDFLSEVLAMSQINKCVCEVVKISIFCHPEPQAKDLNDRNDTGDEILPPHQVRGQNDRKECFVGAELIGYPVDKFDEDIKAVTYEDLDIKKVDGHWETMIVFDI